MHITNQKTTLTLRQARPAPAPPVANDALGVVRWQRHLCAELSCAQGHSVPLEALLARWAGHVHPQHMFDGLCRMLEAGEAELELGPGGYLLALTPQAAAMPRHVIRGELVVLASAIGAVQGRAEGRLPIRRPR